MVHSGKSLRFKDRPDVKTLGGTKGIRKIPFDDRLTLVEGLAKKHGRHTAVCSLMASEGRLGDAEAYAKKHAPGYLKRLGIHAFEANLYDEQNAETARQWLKKYPQDKTDITKAVKSVSDKLMRMERFMDVVRIESGYGVTHNKHAAVEKVVEASLNVPDLRCAGYEDHILEYAKTHGGLDLERKGAVIAARLLLNAGYYKDVNALVGKYGIAKQLRSAASRVFDELVSEKYYKDARDVALIFGMTKKVKQMDALMAGLKGKDHEPFSSGNYQSRKKQEEAEDKIRTSSKRTHNSCMGEVRYRY